MSSLSNIHLYDTPEEVLKILLTRFGITITWRIMGVSLVNEIRTTMLKGDVNIAPGSAEIMAMGNRI